MTDDKVFLRKAFQDTDVFVQGIIIKIKIIMLIIIIIKIFNKTVILSFFTRETVSKYSFVRDLKV